jgi:hypothetical protein
MSTIFVKLGVLLTLFFPKLALKHYLHDLHHLSVWVNRHNPQCLTSLWMYLKNNYIPYRKELTYYSCFANVDKYWKCQLNPSKQIIQVICKYKGAQLIKFFLSPLINEVFDKCKDELKTPLNRLLIFFVRFHTTYLFCCFYFIFIDHL